MDKTFVFWKRIFAFLFDYLILFLFNFIICNLFFNTLIKIGSFGQLIGVLSFILYFGIMNSKIFSGQTLGKKILKIKTVDLNNNYLPLWRTLIGAVLFIPVLFVINSIYFDVKFDTINYFLFGLSYFFIISNAILFIFNIPTRRLLHDLIIGSVVVDISSENIPKTNFCDFGNFYIPDGRFFHLKIPKFIIIIFTVIIALTCSFFKVLDSSMRTDTVFNKKEIENLSYNIENFNNDLKLGAYYAEGWHWGNPQIEQLRITVNTKNECPPLESIKELVEKDLKSLDYRYLDIYCGQAALTGLYTKAKLINSQRFPKN